MDKRSLILSPDPPNPFGLFNPIVCNQEITELKLVLPFQLRAFFFQDFKHGDGGIRLFAVNEFF
jgi:hypothetical protein